MVPPFFVCPNVILFQSLLRTCPLPQDEFHHPEDVQDIDLSIAIAVGPAQRGSFQRNSLENVVDGVQGIEDIRSADAIDVPSFHL